MQTRIRIEANHAVVYLYLDDVNHPNEVSVVVETCLTQRDQQPRASVDPGSLLIPVASMVKANTLIAFAQLLARGEQHKLTDALAEAFK